MHPLADAGRVIAGRYRLQAPIGRGAMGVVWRARDELLDREVAVKEVHIADSLTDDERRHAYQRTLREAKTAARLNHPGVVTVYDVAEDEGRPWIVMQLVNSQSLDQVLAASGPLSPRRAAEMGRQLLSALTVAHAAGVMHRDVKPSNVLLSSDDRAVLTDFGIATFQDDPKLTQTGMVMGSPGFTAPERIRGEDASPASDLWSLGATLYAAVEGHGPFEQRGGALTTMSAIINEDAPQAPSAGALAPVIAALLRREPEDRPNAARATWMITDVLPRLGPAAGTPAGYAPTALAASPSADYGSASRDSGSASRDSASRDSASRDSGQGGLDAAAPTAAASAGYGSGAGAGSGSAARTEGPPPDFSSWYDPSPRSGAAPQQGSGAGTWAGYPHPSTYGREGSGGPGGAGAPGGSGSGSGTAPWSGDRPGYAPRQRRRSGGSGAWWKIALVVLALIGAGAGALTVVLIHRHDNLAATKSSSSSSSTPSSSPSASSTATLPSAATAPQIVNAINEHSTGPLPSGFTTYTHHASGSQAAGFSLAAPTNWAASTTPPDQTFLTDSTVSSTNILIDLTPHTYPNDMLKEAGYIKSQSLAKGTFPDYVEQDLKATTIRGTRGAIWKFTWVNKAGVKQQAIDLLFVMPTSTGSQSYALYMTAPSSMFDQMRPIFDEEVETFTSLPS
jgi:serine/threonine protein kinase